MTELQSQVRVKIKTNNLTCLVENTVNTIYSVLASSQVLLLRHSLSYFPNSFPHECVQQAHDPHRNLLPRSLLSKCGSSEPAARGPKGQSLSEGTLHPPGTEVRELSRPREAHDPSGVKRAVLPNAQVLPEPPRAEVRKCRYSLPLTNHCGDDLNRGTKIWTSVAKIPSPLWLSAMKFGMSKTQNIQF